MNTLWHPDEGRASIPVLNKPLLRRAPLAPGESLPSLLVRLGRLNYYASPTILERVILAGVDWPDSVECPHRRDLFERLALLTGVPAFELYQASDHRFLPSPAQYAALCEQRLPRRILPKNRAGLRSSRAAQFCPYCLQEDPYQRLRWRPAAVTLCLTHHCLLTVGCPDCQAVVSIASLVRGQCAECHGDLGHPRSSPQGLGEWEEVVQQTLWAWLLGEDSPAPQYAWPRQAPETLYHLAEVLAFGVLTNPERFASADSACLVPNPPLEHLAQLPGCGPATLGWAYSLALRGMTHWPEGLREFLHRAVPDPSIPLEQGLGRFYTHGLNRALTAPTFRFVWEAYHQFRFDRRFWSSPTPIPIWSCISMEETLGWLKKVEASVLLRLTQLGQLYHLKGQRLYATEVFFRRSEIRRLRAQWSTPLTQEEAAAWLGLSLALLEQCAQAGLLRGRHTPAGTGRWFTKAAVARLLHQLNTVVPPIPSQLLEPGLSLAEAAEYLAGLGWNEIQLLRAVLARTLFAYHTLEAGEAVAINAMRFTVADLNCCARQIIQDRSWVSEDSAALFFWVDRATIQRWHEQGWLKPVAHFPPSQPLFAYSDLERWQAELISFPEAQQVLQMGQAVLLRRIAQGKITPVYRPPTAKSLGYLFLRKDVEQLARRRKRAKPEAGLTICG